MPFGNWIFDLRHKRMMIILIMNGLRIETFKTPYLFLVKQKNKLY